MKKLISGNASSDKIKSKNVRAPSKNNYERFLLFLFSRLFIPTETMKVLFEKSELSKIRAKAVSEKHISEIEINIDPKQIKRSAYNRNKQIKRRSRHRITYYEITPKGISYLAENNVLNLNMKEKLSQEEIDYSTRYNYKDSYQQWYYHAFKTASCEVVASRLGAAPPLMFGGYEKQLKEYLPEDIKRPSAEVVTILLDDDSEVMDEVDPELEAENEWGEELEYDIDKDSMTENAEQKIEIVFGAEKNKDAEKITQRDLFAKFLSQMAPKEKELLRESFIFGKAEEGTQIEYHPVPELIGYAVNNGRYGELKRIQKDYARAMFGGLIQTETMSVMLYSTPDIGLAWNEAIRENEVKLLETWYNTSDLEQRRTYKDQGPSGALIVKNERIFTTLFLDREDYRKTKTGNTELGNGFKHFYVITLSEEGIENFREVLTGQKEQEEKEFVKVIAETLKFKIIKQPETIRKMQRPNPFCLQKGDLKVAYGEDMDMLKMYQMRTEVNNHPEYKYAIYCLPYQWNYYKSIFANSEAEVNWFNEMM